MTGSVEAGHALLAEGLKRMEDQKPVCGAAQRIGAIAAGWVALHGEFTADQLTPIVSDLRAAGPGTAAPDPCGAHTAVGPILRGQRWVSLHGGFMAEQLTLVLVDLHNAGHGLERAKR